MRKYILVVDDDEGIIEAFKLMLESRDYKVKTSCDADILNKLSKTNLPDLILLDVLLSGVDGRTICKELKSQKETRNIPIIMVSAHPDARKSTLQAGADDFLAKPFEMDTLLSMVEKYIK